MFFETCLKIKNNSAIRMIHNLFDAVQVLLYRGCKKNGYDLTWGLRSYLRSYLILNKTGKPFEC